MSKKDSLFGLFPKISSILFIVLLYGAKGVQQYSFGHFSSMKWNLIPNENIFAIYIRIIGNDLPPRHTHEQTILNLKFVLEHESDFSSLRIYKFWILNRIFDNAKRKRIESLLTEYNQAYRIIPFDYEVYKRSAFDVNKFQITDFLHSPLFFRLSPATRLSGIDHIYHSKNLYAINNNGGRNVAIELGKTINATWTMVFDGNCFMTPESMDQLSKELHKNIASFPDSQSYFVLPMVRMLNNSMLLDDEKVKFINSSSAFGEPQVIFRSDSNLTFHPNFRYGRRPKLDLLWRLGFPRNNTLWHLSPWEEIKVNSYSDSGPTLFKMSQHSWVARLFSGNSIQELSNGESSKLRNTNRIKGIHSFINNISSLLIGHSLANQSNISCSFSSAKKLPPLLFDLKGLEKLKVEYESNPRFWSIPVSNQSKLAEYFQRSSINFPSKGVQQTDVLSMILIKGRMALRSCSSIAELSKLLLSDDVCQYFLNSQLSTLDLTNPYSLAISAATLAINFHILKAEVFKITAFNTINGLLKLESLKYLSNRCTEFLNSRSSFDDFLFFHSFVVAYPSLRNDFWNSNSFCSMFAKEVSMLIRSVPLFLVFDTMSLLDIPIDDNMSLLISYWIQSSKESIGMPLTADAALTLDIHSPLSPLPVWITLPLRLDKNIVYDMNLFSSIYYGQKGLGSLEALAYASMSRFDTRNCSLSSDSRLPSFPVHLTYTAQKLIYNIVFDAETDSKISMQHVTSLSRKPSAANFYSLFENLTSNFESPISALKHIDTFPLDPNALQRNRFKDASKIYNRTEAYFIPSLYLEQNGTIHAQNDSESIFSTIKSSCKTGIQPLDYVNASSVQRSFAMHGIMMAKMVDKILPGLFSKIEETLCKETGSFCRDVETFRFLVL
ncbi:hypothetical protein DI09_74p20 [Mitosporidium daphniae]|uniref:Uncharacterized protein n=1 Tax=Mitosporidium daphniae TaxID=1485682 RepID=A0A098VN65_9MICR|nr:uncharacterized protein DI09_74p20 [Mitosporidium daphniae]KGG50360.1 hypothetical protein DI09_74p20 [Mitosporidium daphniae]|eukprot:XP_013236801.1 uncharacterized protein DI09_74p20 [Mitosporidium daphniae]